LRVEGHRRTGAVDTHIRRIPGLSDLILPPWEPRRNEICSQPIGNSQKGGLVGLAAPKLAALP
jgi:hypothetical protein